MASRRRREDFELVDRMGDGYWMVTNVNELLSILENIGRALAIRNSRGNKRWTYKCFQNIQAKLKSFQQEQESKDTEDAASLRRFSTLSKQLGGE
jgi:hypothetical protein